MQPCKIAPLLSGKKTPQSGRWSSERRRAQPKKRDLFEPYIQQREFKFGKKSGWIILNLFKKIADPSLVSLAFIFGLFKHPNCKK